MMRVITPVAAVFFDACYCGQMYIDASKYDTAPFLSVSAPKKTAVLSHLPDRLAPLRFGN